MRRDRPISFSLPMVRALLSGLKTQTRRVIVPQPDMVGRDERDRPALFHSGKPLQCRYGQPGDGLWVRERWAYRRHFRNPDAPKAGPIVYAADESSVRFTGRAWRQGRHMPRSASRITLLITEIRLQRLRQISPADARAEGFHPDAGFADPIEWFARLWDSINAERGFGWSANPWVWAVTFRRERRRASI